MPRTLLSLFCVYIKLFQQFKNFYHTSEKLSHRSILGIVSLTISSAISIPLFRNSFISLFGVKEILTFNITESPLCLCHDSRERKQRSDFATMQLISQWRGYENFSHRNHDTQYKDYIQRTKRAYVIMIYMVKGIKENIYEEI